MSNVFVFHGLRLKCSPLHVLATSALLLIHSVKGKDCSPFPSRPTSPLLIVGQMMTVICLPPRQRKRPAETVGWCVAVANPTKMRKETNRRQEGSEPSVWPRDERNYLLLGVHGQV